MEALCLAQVYCHSSIQNQILTNNNNIPRPSAGTRLKPQHSRAPAGFEPHATPVTMFLIANLIKLAKMFYE